MARTILRPCRLTPCSPSSRPSSRVRAAKSLAAIPLPDSYRAAFVRRDEVDMFEGLASADKDPRKSLHVDEVLLPELAPDEAYVAVMASSINFNTVWTSIFEPTPDLRLPRPAGQGERVGEAPRARLPRRRLGRRRRGAAGRLGRSQLAAGRPGHRALQLRRRPEPVRPRRLDAGRQPAHLGVRVQLRRTGRHRRWSRPTSSCPSRATSRGRRRPSTRCATRPRTGCWCRRTVRPCARATASSSGAHPAGSAPTPSSTC